MTHLGPHGSGRTGRQGEGIFKQERQVDGFRFLESHKPIMPLIICAFVGTSERREVASDSNYLLGGSVPAKSYPVFQFQSESRRSPCRISVSSSLITFFKLRFGVNSEERSGWAVVASGSVLQTGGQIRADKKKGPHTTPACSHAFLEPLLDKSPLISHSRLRNDDRVTKNFLSRCAENRFMTITYQIKL